MQIDNVYSLVSPLPYQRQQAQFRRLNSLDASRAQVQLLSANDVKLGLRFREFRAYAQPKFKLRTGEVTSIEVLARWHHPILGTLGPATFIPIMAQKKWLDKVLFELLEQSLAYQLKLYKNGQLLGMAFNLSLTQLSETLIENLEVRLCQHPLPLSALTFEITEDGPHSISATDIDLLNRLCLMGVRLSIDDFGTGHSSLLRLCQIPFSEIKLAAEFTLLLNRPQQYYAVTRNTLSLANELDMQFVVEGIETDAQRVNLYEIGVQIGQGFLCAKPMAIDAIEGWISTKDIIEGSTKY